RLRASRPRGFAQLPRLGRELLDARDLRYVQTDVALRALEHHHLALRPRGARLEPHQRPQVDERGHAALLRHHAEKGRRRARHARDETHLGHPAHRGERERVAVASVQADDGAGHGYSSLNRETTVCSSTERLVSSCDADAIEAVTTACSRMARETSSVL